MVLPKLHALHGTLAAAADRAPADFAELLLTPTTKCDRATSSSAAGCWRALSSLSPWSRRSYTARRTVPPVSPWRMEASIPVDRGAGSGPDILLRTGAAALAAKLPLQDPRELASIANHKRRGR
jgi:hypothetical protein